MRILKLVTAQDSGGVFTCEQQHTRILRELGHTVDMAIMGDGSSREAYRAVASTAVDFPVIKARYTGSVWQIWKSLWQVAGSAKASAQLKLPGERYDCIMYGWPNLVQLAAVLGHRLGARVFWYMFGSVNRRLGRWYYRYNILRHSIIPVANSEYTARSLGRVCRHVVYHGFDEDKIRDADDDYRQSLGVPDDAVVFGMAARMAYDKAQDLVIEAFDRLVQEGGNAHLVIAGGPLDTAFGRKCRELAQTQASRVHFLGYVHTGGKYYNTVDYFINSRRNAEAYGISVAEALGAGKPVIAYYLGGPSEMIVEGVNGWLLQHSDAREYQRAMQRAIAQWDRYGSLSRQAVESSWRLTARHNVEKLAAILEQHAQSKAGRTR